MSFMELDIDTARLRPHLRSRTRLRTLRACLGCGAPSVEPRCPSCVRPDPHDHPEYRRNAAIVRASATHCWLCGEGARADDPWTADHVVRPEDGGGHGLDNLRAAHRSCNSARGARQGALLQ